MLANCTANASLIARRTTTHYITFTLCQRLAFCCRFEDEKAMFFSEARALTAQEPQAFFSA
jgi:hypothetical protein